MGYPTPDLPSAYRPQQLRDRVQWFHLVPLLLVLPYIKQSVDRVLFPAPTPAFIIDGLARCADLHAPAAFRARLASEKRTQNDRFVPGTEARLLTNGTLWTGLDYGNEIIHGGSILLRDGLIHAIGQHLDVVSLLTKHERHHVEEVNLNGAWVSPGIVDMHSHLGVSSSPELKGSDDTNSIKAPILPWLRSIDGFNTHDAAFNLSIAGGLTTALILPGSANNMGGQAFMIKPRQTSENSPSSMQVDPPFVIDENGGIKRTGHWRHSKMATGENIHGLYGDTRLDQAWNFRDAFRQAAELRDKQDAWCAAGKSNSADFPDDLKWEALADLLRGNLKANCHSYELVDFDELVRLTNEFKFELAAVHHAHEAYLATETLKKAWGTPPAAAIFATNSRYKREAFRGSEFAPKLLADAGISVVMKSDHPVLDSRFLLFEAQQAHLYGLPAAIALSSVTTTPARVLGVDHRLGSLRAGNDADLVVWDSHPLQLGATPIQVYIDGIAQLDASHQAVRSKAALQVPPRVPDWGDEAQIHKDARGNPDYAALLKGKPVPNGDVAFINVRNVWMRSAEGDGDLVDLAATDEHGPKTVIVRSGKIACVGRACVNESLVGIQVIDLQDGSLVPGLISFGSTLGTGEIVAEKSTMDGRVKSNEDLILAVDGASFATKDALIAARSGVSVGISAPVASSQVAGLSFAFNTGAPHPLAPHAVLQEVVALHVTVGHAASEPISVQVSNLRKLLLGQAPDAAGYWAKATKGEIPVVIAVDKLDIMARLVSLKKEIGHTNGTSPRFVFHGATEAHAIAHELAAANIGVIVTGRPFPTSWDQRRIEAGLPLTQHSAIDTLVRAGVTVGLGIVEAWSARNTRFESGWAFINSDVLDKKAAYALSSHNLEKLLGLKVSRDFAERDWVAVAGDLFSFEGKVVAKGGAEGVALF